MQVCTQVADKRFMIELCNNYPLVYIVKNSWGVVNKLGVIDDTTKKSIPTNVCKNKKFNQLESIITGYELTKLIVKIQSVFSS